VWFLPDKELAAEKTVNIGKKGLTSAAHWQIKRPVLAPRQIAHALNLCRFRGHSSAGRAPALQAGGRRFDPVWLHQIFQIASGIKDQSAMLWLRLCLLFVCTVLFKRPAINEHFNLAVEILRMIGHQQRFQLPHLLVHCF
jgi:hypothetical protein